MDSDYAYKKVNEEFKLETPRLSIFAAYVPDNILPYFHDKKKKMALYQGF